jgi:hypothetical protein
MIFNVIFYYFLGDEAMFGDAEHYKYLTNEADLNNVGDDSIALTPKTPKKASLLSLKNIVNIRIFFKYFFLGRNKFSNKPDFDRRT